MEHAGQAPAELVSRRDMLKKTAAVAALSLPLVTTLIAPTPAHAQSAPVTMAMMMMMAA